ncbi:unnamed protein product [Somion occarium]|uniref:Dicer n=1 Tax=Somion occarium TaxID=3059160 RepID=A0ABP1D2U8_9APHY
MASKRNESHIERKRHYAGGSVSSTSDIGRPQKRQRVEDNGSNVSFAKVVVTYEPPPGESKTTLYNQLRTLDPSGHFSRRFRDAKRVMSALGSSAADLYWRRWMESLDSGTRDETEHSVRSAMHNLIESWTFEMPTLFSKYSSSNVSSQFSKFVQILQSCEPYAADFRGIVIVRHSAVATMMVEMLQCVDETMDTIRPAVIIPSDTLRGKNVNEILERFATGTYNLLILSKHTVNMSIIQPSAMVWYDLFGEPRPSFNFTRLFEGHRSHMVYMAEAGNDTHKQLLLSWGTSPSQRKDSREPAREDESSCPFSDATTSAPTDEGDDEDEERYIQDPTTNRQLRPRDAQGVLMRFLSASTNDDHLDLDHVFQVTRTQNGQYLCKVKFPEGLPQDTITGFPKPTPAKAQREASFLACQSLFHHGLLEYPLFPNAHGGLPEILDDATGPEAIAASGMRRYAKATPIFWTNSLSASSQTLYPLVVKIEGTLGNAAHAPVVVLTRLPFPPLRQSGVFSGGEKAVVSFQRGAPLEVDEDKLHLLHLYTLRVSRTLTNKELNFSAEELPYFWAPLNCDSTDVFQRKSDAWARPTISEHIPWDLVRTAAENCLKPLVTEGTDLDEACKDAIVQDRWVEFTNRHYVVEVRHDLTPLSKAEDSPREADFASFLDYCKTHRKNFEGLRDENQPMIQVSPVAPLVDYLNPVAKPYRTAQRTPMKYLIPELCCKFTIPASTFRTLQILPSIMHRISDQLLAKQLNDNLFDNQLSEEHLFEALFPPSADTESSYERLELLGDAYLKYVASVYLYVTMPGKRENTLHAARRDIVSNKTLHTGAVAIGLPALIRGKPFLPKVWQPTIPRQDSEQSGISKPPSASSGENQAKMSRTSDSATQPANLPQPEDVTRSTMAKRGKRKKQQDEQAIQWLGDKTVADVVEAIIGAAYLSRDRDLALQVAKRLNVPLPGVERWSDLESKYNVPSGQQTVQLSAQTVKAVEAIVGFKFRQPALLAEALTHNSIQQSQQVVGYDRLEYLGDAILDFYVVKNVYKRYPLLSSGGLSMLKSAMVLNTTLATICVFTGLYEHIQYASRDVEKSIQLFANKIKILRGQELEQAKAEGRQPGQYWLEVPAPKVLSDVVEALLGALFVSERFSEVGTDAFFHKVLEPFFSQHIRMQTLSHHPNIALYEWFQAEGCQEHQIVKSWENEQTRCDVVVHDTVLASAMDPSPTVARRMVAFFALDALEGDPQFMSRICSCRVNRINKKLQKQQLGYEDEDDAQAVENVLGQLGEIESE